MPGISAKEIRGSDRGYTAYHAPRYALLLSLMSRYGVSSSSRILDIGRSDLTTLLRTTFDAKVDTLGFEADSDGPEGRHFFFDLNQAQRQSTWRTDLPKYDAVVMAEVIEHLYTAPELVLAFVRSLVADGGLFFLGTPNAASLTKRIKALIGRNPYERIRIDNTAPGHFREYTMSELKAVTAGAGFTLLHRQVDFAFDARYQPRGIVHDGMRPVLGTTKNIVYRLLPEFLREGITMVLRADRPAKIPVTPAKS
jgi:hypothetical protein